MSQCKEVADHSIPRLVHGIKATMQRPDSVQAQTQLIQAAQDMLAVCSILYHMFHLVILYTKGSLFVTAWW